jgi:hypothetical protein
LPLSTVTPPVISACALIAFQSENCTGLAKLVMREICASRGISRKRPVPLRSEAMTRRNRWWQLCRGGVVGNEIGHGIGQGLDHALGDLDPKGPSCAIALGARSTGSDMSAARRITINRIT